MTDWLTQARQHSPADPEVAACWDLIVKGIAVGWFDPDEMRELMEHLRDHRDFGVEELRFAHVGDRLRVSFLDDKATCSPSAMLAALIALSAPDSTMLEPPPPVAVTFPTSNPDGEAGAHVEFGASLDDVPTWSLQTLNTGPARSSPAYGRHLEATIGSSYDWGDELRFDKCTGKLRSFVLKTPEAGALEPAIARSWLALPRRTVLPVLDHRENGFHVDPLDLRHLAEDAAALVAASAALPHADRDSLRLAIGRDTDLLFHHGRYSGWILGSPIAHLVSGPGDAAPGTDDPRLHEPLREYLALVVEPNIARMGDEDPDLRKALCALQARARGVDGGQARALESGIERVLDTFYPG